MKRTTATAILTILAVLALASIPALAGPNILANGNVTLAAGGTNATDTIGLYNIDGQEWSEIYGFRIYNASTNAVNVQITCEDSTIPVTLYQKDITLTNTPQHLAASTVLSVAGSNYYAKTVKIHISLIGATNVTSAVNLPYLIYAK